MQLKNQIISKSDDQDDNKTQDLILTRKGGGSVIDKRPLFSSDGEWEPFFMLILLKYL